MAMYLNSVWEKIKTGTQYNSYKSLAGLDAVLIATPTKGVVVDHKRGAKKVLVSLNGDIATVTGEYPKIFHNGHETKNWILGQENIPEEQFEKGT